MQNKKSNPFKLWGAYFGGLISFFVFPFCRNGFLSSCQAARDSFINALQTNIIGNLIPALEIFIGTFGLGFLIGWGIHAFILSMKE